MSRGNESGQLAGGSGDHAVQFYEAEDELAGPVSRYLAAGIRSGDGVVVVATAPHRRAFEAGLTEIGVDPGAEQDAGRLLMVDAASLLATFLADERLDHDRFQAAAAGLMQRATGKGRPVRMYAEMVAVLWDAGEVPLAIELEGLWNGLGARLPFSLLCGYPAGALSDEDTDAVQDVRRLHSAVADARSFREELDSVRAARHYVMNVLDPVAGRAVGADAELVATELAANAVLHAHSGFTLTVSRSAAGIRIAVRDSAPLESAEDDIPFAVTAGHGLSVVAQLATRWGVDRLPDGKVVWVELTLAPPSVPRKQLPERA